MSTHKCPGGCNRDVPQAKLSCPDCWRRLPAYIKALVNTAYREHNWLAHRAAMGLALDWYKANPLGQKA